MRLLVVASLTVVTLFSSCKLFTSNSTIASTTPLPRKPLVLMYHNIVTGETTASSDTTVDALKAQLDYLTSIGYQTIGTKEYYEARANNQPLPDKSVLLTFDDGYSGNYTYALPMLRARHMKATFFIHTNYIGTGPGTPSQSAEGKTRDDRIKECFDNRNPTSLPHMTWDQIQEIANDPLFEVYAHTHNHPRLTDFISGTNSTLNPDEEYKIKMELECPRRLLEAKLGGDRPFFAYPYGAHNSKIIQSAKKYYKMAFIVASSPDVVDATYQIPRLDVGTNSLKLSVFKCRVNNWVSRQQLSACGS